MRRGAARVRGRRRSSCATSLTHLERIGVARQKWPEEVRVVAEFPRTASGKVRKVDLRRELPRRRDVTDGLT